MNAVHFVDGHRTQNHNHDLESAFNDGFQAAANTVSAALLRWLVLLWAAVTIGIGTFVIARAILEFAPTVMSGLAQLISAA